MKLSGFRVTKYKGVVDSGWIDVEDLTVLVGKNEAGKTTLLRALHKLNPATPDPYDIDREWPRGNRRGRDETQVVCSARFTLNPEEGAALAKITNQEEQLGSVEVTRDYAGHLEVVFPARLGLDKLHPNEVDAHCEELPMVTQPVAATFQEVARQAREEAHRLAAEGRYEELEGLHKKQVAVLEAAMSPAGTDPQHQNEQSHLNELGAAATRLAAKLSALPSMQAQAHEFVVTRLPKFIYMADYRAFTGSALLDQVRQRKRAKKLLPDDQTFLMILELSGLDLDELVAKGATPQREQRQYDVHDGANTLTGMFAKRLKQREYEIEFRLDGDEFLTLVKDKSAPWLIQLEERSKGFQWFFSFDLLFMHESGGTFENCVVLLDEPGLHLHPGAQQDLLARLEAYATGNTLIYSTHLPFMIDLTRPERIRVINESEHGAVVTHDLTQTQPEAKLTLQAALGMSASQSYLVAKRNVVVEGVDDYIILNELSELLWRTGQDGLPDDVHITACGGASEVAYIATFMIAQQLTVVALLDSDSAGSIAEDKLVKTWLTRYKGRPTQVLSLGATVGAGAKEFAIEDLFPDDFYLARVKEVYARELTAAGGAERLVLVGMDQLSKRVERALDALGIKLNKRRVATHIRGDLRRMKSADELPPLTREYAEKLIAALAKALA